MLTETFSTIKAGRGILALEAITPPNTLRRADFATRMGNNTVVHRLIIVQDRDGEFLLKEFKYNVPRSHQPIIKMTYKKLQYDFQAAAKFDEVSNILTENNFTRISHRTFELVELFSEPFYKHRIIGNKRRHFKPTSEDVIQSVNGGIHCFLKINQYGDIALHEINHVNEKMQNKNIVSPYIKCFADSLIAMTGFRGALIEGFATKEAFEIIDVGYIGDTDMRHLSLDERLALIPSLIGENPEKYGVSFSCPATTYEKLSNAEYLVSRKNYAGFSLTSNKPFNTCVYSSANVIELEAIECIKGTIHCNYLENDDLTYDFEYLTDNHIVSLENYTLSETSINSPIIL